MRISDWSSDVCSSDLPDQGGVVAEQAHRPQSGRDRAAHLRTPAMRLGSRQEGEDRKSVVQGKSVSVRVDLGGRRLIKKKNSELRQRDIEPRPACSLALPTNGRD